MRSKSLKTRWGVRHYAMVNSGNHIMSVFPMDGPLSICGHNNLDKTQALQSMQFLFNNFPKMHVQNLQIPCMLVDSIIFAHRRGCQRHS